MRSDDRKKADSDNGKPVKGAVDSTGDIEPASGRPYLRRLGDVRQPPQSSNAWLLSFSDIMALMLTFFVLLFSMSEPAKKDWNNISGAMQAEFNKFYGAAANRGPQDSVNIEKINFNRALSIGYLNALLESVTAASPLLAQATLTPQPGQLVISLPRALLFEAGDASVREEGSRALYALGGSLARIRNRIEIIGHADPRPMGQEDGAFDSNWELSLMRAANVAAILENVGYQKEIIVRGHSSGLYEDLQGRLDEESRLAVARRVDIVILDHEGDREIVFTGASEP